MLFVLILLNGKLLYVMCISVLLIEMLFEIVLCIMWLIVLLFLLNRYSVSGCGCVLMYVIVLLSCLYGMSGSSGLKIFFCISCDVVGICVSVYGMKWCDVGLDCVLDSGCNCVLVVCVLFVSCCRWV